MTRTEKSFSLVRWDSYTKAWASCCGLKYRELDDAIHAAGTFARPGEPCAVKQGRKIVWRMA